MNLDIALVDWCQNSIDQLLARSSDLLECVVLTPDGFSVAQGHQRSRGLGTGQEGHTARLSTITSSLHAVAKALAQETEISKLKSIMIDADRGKLVVASVQLAEHFLVVALLAKPSALTGSLLFVAREFVSQLHEYPHRELNDLA